MVIAGLGQCRCRENRANCYTMQPNHKSYNPTLIAFKPVKPYDYRLPPFLFIIAGCFKP